VRETVNFLAGQKLVPMSREEPYSLTSIVGDCRVSQVVDIRKSVDCMIKPLGKLLISYPRAYRAKMTPLGSQVVCSRRILNAKLLEKTLTG